ncbi:MAG: hypothetical protein ACOCVF_00565 [bacterium]
MINVINENVQQMERFYVKTNLFTEQDVKNVLSITNGDNYTYKIAQFYDVYMSISNKHSNRMKPEYFNQNSILRENLIKRYNDLKTYNKNTIFI